MASHAKPAEHQHPHAAETEENGMAQGRGRPEKIDSAKVLKMLTYMRAGTPPSMAAAAAGIRRSTMDDWLRYGARVIDEAWERRRRKIRKSDAPYAEFSEAMERAVGEFVVSYIGVVAQAAQGRAAAYDDKGRLVRKEVSAQWQAGAWLLERRFPDQFGRKWIEDGEARPAIGGGEINMNVLIVGGSTEDYVTKLGRAAQAARKVLGLDAT